MNNLLLLSGYWEYYLMGIILIPGIILSIYAQIKVNNTANTYSQVASKSGKTGAEVAQILLEGANINNVKIKRIGGNLTDYYSHSKKTIALSQDIYNSNSVTALGVAAHECGHAIQYKTHYFPIILRNIAIPVSNVASILLWPLVIIGMIFSFGVLNSGAFGNIMLWSGIAVFGFAVIVNLVTLPCEFDASRRALKLLKATGLLDEEEVHGAKQVLDAAALTYVAALIVSILNFLRFVLVFADRRR